MFCDFCKRRKLLWQQGQFLLFCTVRQQLQPLWRKQLRHVMRNFGLQHFLRNHGDR